MRRRAGPQASGKCQGDNPDSLMHQEVLLPGHLLQQFFKEHLQDWQTRLKELFLKEAQDKPSVNFEEAALVEKCVTKACGYVDVGKRMTYLLSTGNLASRTGMGQTQKSGFTIVAEKLNFLRYLSHFRSVHRGAYFQELRTTTARRSARRARLSSRAPPLTPPVVLPAARRSASCCPTRGASCALCTRQTARRAGC